MKPKAGGTAMGGGQWRAKFVAACIAVMVPSLSMAAELHWGPIDSPEGKLIDRCDPMPLEVGFTWTGTVPFDFPANVYAHVNGVPLPTTACTISKPTASGTCTFILPSGRCTMGLQVGLEICPDFYLWTEPAFLYTQCGSAPAECTPNPTCEDAIKAGQCVGSPIDVTTGNVWYHKETARATNGDSATVFDYRYDSERRSRIGWMGPGFRHSFEETLDCTPNLTAPEQCVYNNARGDQWTCVASWIEKAAFPFWQEGYVCDGPVDLRKELSDPLDPGFRVSNREHEEKDFKVRPFGGVQGLRLTDITDRFGTLTNLSYSFGPTGSINILKAGVLSKLNFYQGSNGWRLSSVHLPGVPVPEAIRFEYASAGERFTKLTREIDPGPPAVQELTSYEWDTGPDPNLLRAVRDGSGHVLESWTYDSAGRGTGFEREGGAEKIEKIVYADNTTTVEYQDVVNPLSPTPEVIDDAVFSVDRSRKRVDARTGPCVECPGRVEVKRVIAWDRTWPKIYLIRDGSDRVTEYTREVSRKPIRKWNVTEMEEHIGGLKRRTEICYHQDFNEPVLIEMSTTGSCDPDDPVIPESTPCHGTVVEGDHMTIHRELFGVAGISDEVVSGCRGGVKFSQSRHTEFDSEKRVAWFTGWRPDVTRPTTFEYPTLVERKPSAVRVPVDVNPANDLVWRFVAYDSMGRLTTMKDPNLTETHFTFDRFGHLLEDRIQDALLSDVLRTTYTYDYLNDSVMSSMTRPQQQGATPSQPWTMVHDGAHRLLDLVDPVGNIARSIYDSRSRVRRRELLEPGTPSPVVKWFNEYDWDDFSRMVVRRFDSTPFVGPSAVQSEFFTWEGTGRLESSQDAAGDVTHYAYDGLGRLQLKRQFSPLGQLLAEHEFGYDMHDNLTRLTPPNRLPMVFKYGDDGSLLETNLFDAGRTLFDHDPDGNLTLATDARGVAVSRVWDWAGRLTQVNHPTAPSENVVRRYDENLGPGCFGKGRLTSMTDPANPDPASPVQFCYDAFGRLLSESRPGFGSAPTSFTWDRNGNMTGITYPFTNDVFGRRSVYQYDAADRVNEVRVWFGGIERKVATAIEHLPFGPIRKMQLFDPLDVRRERTFDQSYRLITDDVAFLSPAVPDLPLFNRRYGYDAHGFLTQVGSSLRPTSNRLFTHDPLHQLTSATALDPAMWGTGTYTYDEAGNRKTRTLGFEQLELLYEHPRLKNRMTATREGGTGGVTTPIGYDQRGNVTNIGLPPAATKAYTYTRDGQTRTVQHGTTSFATYTYDGDGRARRIEQLLGMPQPAEIDLFVYVNGHELLEEKQTPAKGLATPYIAQSYIWLEGEPLARVDSWEGPATEQMFVYLTDPLGTPVEMLTDPVSPATAPGSAWNAEYEPFGELYPAPAGAPATLPSQANRLRFLGQRYDDTGSRLHQNWHRDYDPRLGRYRQADPLWSMPEAVDAAISLGGGWLGRDPIGAFGGANLYAYAGNSPLNAMDPMGLYEYPGGYDYPHVNDGSFAPPIMLPGSTAEIPDHNWAGGRDPRWLPGQHSTDGDGCSADPAADPINLLAGLGAAVARSVAGGTITGYTRHGLNQAISRDGVGVSARAILDAVKNPVKKISQPDGTVKYIGADAIVILNPSGKVVTLIGTSKAGLRTP